MAHDAKNGFLAVGSGYTQVENNTVEVKQQATSSDDDVPNLALGGLMATSSLSFLESGNSRLILDRFHDSKRCLTIEIIEENGNEMLKLDSYPWKHANPLNKQYVMLQPPIDLSFELVQEIRKQLARPEEEREIIPGTCAPQPLLVKTKEDEDFDAMAEGVRVSVGKLRNEPYCPNNMVDALGSVTSLLLTMPARLGLKRAPPPTITLDYHRVDFSVALP